MKSFTETQRLEFFEAEIDRIGADHDSVGPAESLTVEVRGDLARIWDDWESSVIHVEDLVDAFESTKDGAGPQEFWAALTNYPELDRDEVWDARK